MSKQPQKRPSNSSREHQPIIARKETYYSGQLPPPEMLEQFERIQPGFSDRLLTMVEKEGEFKREQDKKSLSTFARSTYLGIVCALIAVLAVCSVSAYSIYMGDARSASWIMGGSCAAVIIAFLNRKYRNRE